MAYIGNPPAQFIIPVTLGTDREFTLNRNDGTPQKTPIDWAATVSMAIDIDKTAPTVLAATVSGNQAVIVIPSATADLVKDKSTRWRIYMQTGGLTTAIAVGSFERDDGGA